jgi:hypothetical protein
MGLLSKESFMNIKMLKAAFAGLALSVSGFANAGLIVNGSLTGAISNGGVPAGWSSVRGSADTMNQNNNVGVPGLGGFQATPSSSPDGGTWVGFARQGNFQETFGQLVSGFSIGGTYELSWYHGNFGYSNYNGANAIEVLLDNVVIGNGTLLSLSSNWQAESISFEVTSLNHRIDFRLRDSATSYHSIDGISLVQASVPEPSTLAIFALGMIGLASRRFKKQ